MLAVLSELRERSGSASIGISAPWLTAAENARRLGLSCRARFVAGDWAGAIGGSFDAILANPPYVEDEALPALPAEVIGFDPRLALAGGADGIDPYRIIIPGLPMLLAPAGFAVLEFGPRQSGLIEGIAATAGMKMEVRHDLAGRERGALLTVRHRKLTKFQVPKTAWKSGSERLGFARPKQRPFAWFGAI